MVQCEMDKDFVLVYRLIQLVFVLLAVERVFSVLKIIKTELRNKMGND